MILENPRYEKKFLDKGGQFAKLEEWVKLNNYGFIREYPNRIVNNIYFDNLELNSFAENLSGVSSRMKIRLRWYDSIQTSKEASLELKIKKNKVGYKKINKIVFPENIDKLNINQITSQINHQLSKESKLFFGLSSQATIYNNYERSYFISLNRKVRITLDKNLNFYDQRFKAKINNLFKTVSPDVTILELKSGIENYDECAQVLSRMELPQSRSSKYIIGVNSVMTF